MGHLNIYGKTITTMKMILNPGATPLEPEELEQLIPQFLITQSQLNAYELENISEAEKWLSRKKLTTIQILDISFLLELHKRMFSDTWEWAGQFRKSNKNIGCDKVYISQELKNLLEDIKCQIQCQTYSYQEIAARFHHRLVRIHPFPNGNGRHARMATDALLKVLHQKPFFWNTNYQVQNKIRMDYIAALKAADKQDYLPLFKLLEIEAR
jgi:Fic-DOC domain mobile mystery protein B